MTDTEAHVIFSAAALQALAKFDASPSALSNITLEAERYADSMIARYDHMTPERGEARILWRHREKNG